MPQKEKKKDKEVGDIEKSKAQAEEYLAGWQRAKADLANYKKDEIKRLEEIVRFANTEILLDLIRVMDSFELGLSALEKAGPVEKGVYLIKSQLENVMKQYGLEGIEVNEGDKFDVSMHEAIVSVEGESLKEGLIAGEVEKGYKLHGRILRAPKVKVYKKEENK